MYIIYHYQVACVSKTIQNYFCVYLLSRFVYHNFNYIVGSHLFYRSKVKSSLKSLHLKRKAVMVEELG